MNTFRIGGLGIRLELPEPITVDGIFVPFACPVQEPDIRVLYDAVSAIPTPVGQPMESCTLFRVHRTESGFGRFVLDDRNGYRPFACARPGEEKGLWRFSCLEGFEHLFLDSRVCLGYLPLEDMLLEFDRFVLHSSFVSTAFGGLLFSGPSGIGKSTQASLWERYENGFVINGDKPILGRPEGKWMAYGSPYAGSSRCYYNESAPVTAIVTLAQGKTCSIRRLSAAEAFRRLYAQTVIHSWDSAFVAKICDLLSDLIAAVPVYHMVCTPDQAAVETVKAVLSANLR